MSTRDRGHGICDVGDALRSFPYSPARVSGQDEIPPCPSEGLDSGIKKAGIRQEMHRLFPGAPMFLSGG